MADQKTESDSGRGDVAGQQVAAMYAKALLGASEKAGQTESVLGELEAIVTQSLDPNPKFEAILGSGFIDHLEKVKILDRVFGGRVSTLLLNAINHPDARGMKLFADALMALMPE